MTVTCKHCGSEIAQRFVGTVVVWGHLTNPRNDHHYAVPANPTRYPSGTPAHPSAAS